MSLLIRAALASAITFSSMERMASVDLLLHNGKVFTAVAGKPLQQAVAVADGKIFKVGSDAEVMALKESGTQVIDLGGKVLMPGFIDSHAHAIFGGMKLITANLDLQVLPFAELEQRLRKWRDDGSARSGDILSVGGFISTYWSDIAEFEKRFNQGEWADQPIFFVGWDYHTGWANQAMLKRAGIDAARIKALPVDAQGTIGHDPQRFPC